MPLSADPPPVPLGQPRPARARAPSTAFAKMKNEDAVRLLMARDQRMALLGAEMRNIHKRSGIVGAHPQHLPIRDRREALAGFEHRERTQQPAGVEVGVRFGECGSIGHPVCLAEAAPILKRALICIAALFGLALCAAGSDISAAAAGEPEGTGAVVYTIVGADRIEGSLTGEPGDPARGAEIFADPERGACAGCHAEATGPHPRGAAPALKAVGERLQLGTLRLWIVAPEVLAPETEMPAYFAAGQRRGADDPRYGGPQLSASEIEDLVAYLAGLGRHRTAPGPAR